MVNKHLRAAQEGHRHRHGHRKESLEKQNKH